VERVSFPSDTASFEVTLVPEPDCGLEPDAPCTHSATPLSHRATIRALRDDGTLDMGFNGAVVISLIPSGLLTDAFLLGDGRHVRTVELTDGEASDVALSYSRAFGDVRLLVEDLGYRPRQNVTEAACYELYPSEGCYARDDDDPSLGSGAVGVSEPIYFTNPRVYDLQYTVVEVVDEAEGWPSPLAGFRPTLDGASRDELPALADCTGPQGRRELLVVTGLSVDGFFVTDVCNAAGPDFAHLYVYNFHTPEGMERGDCLTSLTGTIQEFQGFTELKNPFWQVDCDPSDPACSTPRCTDLLPPPVLLDSATLEDDFAMEGLEAGLVELRDVITASEYRSCDLNGNGAISGDAEWDCQRDCGDDPACVVLESYETYFQWTVTKDGREINVVTRGTLEFDPREHLGEPLRRITGTLRHLHFGRPPWTIIPRDDADFEM
jgi:hypothetical protein